MADFLISYDLIKPEKDYPDLTNALRTMGAVKVLFSEWMYRTGSTCSEIHEIVRTRGKMDANDKLLVVEVSDWTADRNVNGMQKFL